MTKIAVLLTVLTAVGFFSGCGSSGFRVAAKQSSTLTPESGIVLFSAIKSPVEAFATDLQGNIVWQYNFDSQSEQYAPAPIKQLSNGDLLLVLTSGDGVASCSTCGSDNLIREIDLKGNTVWQLTNAQLQSELTDAGYNITLGQMSHDAVELPNGHLIVIISDTRQLTGLTGQSGTTTVEGGGLVELDSNHEPVWVWDAFDHLDVNRHPYFPLPDWIHANAVVYSPDDGNLIFSSRSQSWLMKIDYQNGAGSGNILWRLGYQGDFTLTGGSGPIDWFYGQHGPIILSANSTGVFQLGMFDNGNSRVLDTSGAMCGASGQPDCYSTVPIFQIDETNKTAAVVWRDKLPFFSSALGDMQVLSNGDVWFDAGTVGATNSAIVREVTMDANPQTVLELDVSTPVYRAIHMPQL